MQIGNPVQASAAEAEKTPPPLPPMVVTIILQSKIDVTAVGKTLLGRKQFIKRKQNQISLYINLEWQHGNNFWFISSFERMAPPIQTLCSIVLVLCYV